MSVFTGDPAGMRAAAAQLRSRAEVISGVAANIDVSAAGMGYAGPAAEVFQTTISTQGTNLRGVVARMAALADRLVREAAILEEQQRQQAAATW